MSHTIPKCFSRASHKVSVPLYTAPPLSQFERCSSFGFVMNFTPGLMALLGCWLRQGVLNPGCHLALCPCFPPGVWKWNLWCANGCCQGPGSSWGRVLAGTLLLPLSLRAPLWVWTGAFVTQQRKEDCAGILCPYTLLLANNILTTKHRIPMRYLSNKYNT